MGFATLLSNSLTMGISEFLSSRAHKEFLQAEKRREMWEFKHYKDGEIQEVRSYFEFLIEFLGFKPSRAFR